MFLFILILLLCCNKQSNEGTIIIKINLELEKTNGIISISYSPELYPLIYPTFYSLNHF